MVEIIQTESLIIVNGVLVYCLITIQIVPIEHECLDAEFLILN